MKTIIIMLGLACMAYSGASAQNTNTGIAPNNPVNMSNLNNSPNLNQGANSNLNQGANYNNTNYNHSPNYYQNQNSNPYEQNNNNLAPVNNVNNNNTMTPFNNAVSPYDFTSPYYTPATTPAPQNNIPPVR